MARPAILFLGHVDGPVSDTTQLFDKLVATILTLVKSGAQIPHLAASVMTQVKDGKSVYAAYSVRVRKCWVLVLIYANVTDFSDAKERLDSMRT